VGNGCWGGGKDSVMCNGPNEDRNTIELYHGKGLISTALYSQIQATCAFQPLPFDSPTSHRPSLACERLLHQADGQVGPHNVYNVYDNCEGATQFYLRSGFTPRTLARFVHANWHNASAMASLAAGGGGYDWTCGTFDALPAYFARPEVRAALNLPANSLTSTLQYDSSGPASITLYPALLAKLRILIYNGDADACVPYVGNEEWTAGLAAQGLLVEAKAWHPWYETAGATRPVGYATSYRRAGDPPTASPSFAFVTLRLAGHEAPHYEPATAFAMFERFITGQEW